MFTPLRFFTGTSGKSSTYNFTKTSVVLCKRGSRNLNGLRNFFKLFFQEWPFAPRIHYFCASTDILCDTKESSLLILGDTNVNFGVMICTYKLTIYFEGKLIISQKMDQVSHKTKADHRASLN